MSEYLSEAKTALKNLKKRYKKTNVKFTVKSVKVTRQGNFTVVTVNKDVVGVAKRNASCDQSNPLTGFHTALNKALKYALKIA